MALPLKSGLDLYNNEALRMRLHNLGADPTSDFGVGQAYFNTSTSEGSGKRVRIYDGSAFRSLAYFDEFTALQTKVNAFLDGGVDADGVLENLAEIQKFLDNYSSATDLSEILGKKLDKTGGKIKNGATTAPLNIDSDGASTRIGFYKSGTLMGYFAFGETNVPNFTDTNGGRYSLLHSGNVGEYALFEKTAKTLTASNSLDSYTQGLYTYQDGNNPTNAFGDNAVVMAMKGAHSTVAFQLAFEGNNPGNIGYRRRNTSGTWQDWKTLAFTDSDITGNAASATKLETARTIWGQTFDGTGNVSGDLTLGYSTIRGASKESAMEINAASLNIGYDYRTAGKTTTVFGDTIRMAKDGAYTMFINSSGNVTIGASDLAGDRKLYVAGKGSFIGADSKEVQVTVGNTVNTVQLGVTNVGVAYMFTKNAYDMAFSTSGARRMTITAGGNVLIGTTEDDESGAKLQVAGHAFISNTLSTGSYFDLNRSAIGGVISDTTRMALEMQAQATSIRFSLFDKNGTWKGIPMEFLENGDVHISGNLIVEGEVSAGGAGEEGDTGTGTGGGDALIYSQEFTPTTTSITITHNLSATKGVIVQVWEKNGNYWDMVLVDVEEVDTNTVTLFFGKTETTVHKVVIMG